MDTLTTLINITLIWSVAAATPGPNFVLTVQTAAGNSRRLGLATAGGIVTGTCIWGLAGFFGVSALFAATPWLYASLKVAGGLYLIYLGLRLIVNSVRRPARIVTPPPNANRANSLLRPARGKLMAAWRLGLVTNLSNPKTAMFVSSLFATTMPADPTMALGFSAAAVMMIISLVWYGAVASVFASPLVAGWYGRAANLVDRVAGGIFVLFGAKMVFDR